MENLEKGIIYDSSDYCKYYCYGNQHGRYLIQYLQQVSNQKATALPQGVWLLLDSSYELR